MNLLAEFFYSIPFSNQEINDYDTENERELEPGDSAKDEFSIKALDQVRRVIAQSSLVTKRSNSRQKSSDSLDPTVSDVEK